MSEIIRRSTSWVSDIYDGWFAKDVLGKIVPGSVLLLALAEATTSQGHLATMRAAARWPAAVWFLFAGVAWLTGLAAQGLWEAILLLPKGRRKATHELVTLQARLDTSAGVTAAHKEQARRYGVIKEAGSSGVVTCAVAAAIEGVLGHSCLRVGMLALGAGGLGCVSLRNQDRQLVYLREVLRIKKPDVQVADGSDALASPASKQEGR